MIRKVAAATAATIAAIALTAGTASAANPTILNTATGCAGQTAWLVSCAAAGATNNNGNVLRISALVSHDAANTISSLITDDDWDGTNDPTNVRAATSTKPSIATNYSRSRVNLTYTLPTSNTGLSCGFLSGTRSTTDRNARIQARDSAAQSSGTSSSQIKFVSADQCTGPEDPAYLYSWGPNNFGNSITPGTSLNFTYTGDDPDTTGSSDFQGIGWRTRNLRTGALGGVTVSCPGNGDNAEKSLSVTFPRRGAYVVEAELRDGDGCSDNQAAGFWFPIGTADVNSATIPAPTLSATRPQIGGTSSVNLTPPVDPDTAEGGGAQIIQWDLDENTTNGVSGFETDTVAGEGAIITGNQTKTVNTTGLTPGLHTVRARVIDNGAMDAADGIRRTSTTTTAQFLVDTPPVSSGSSIATESGQPVAAPLSATDANGDPLSYTIQTQPANGTISGTGASRTYTPNPGFAGTDSFSFRANDGFGGTSDSTVTVTVRPNTAINSAPSGTINSRAAQVGFGSPVSGATFECSFDGAAFTACVSPVSFADLADGPHTLSVRASAASLTDPTPAFTSFTVDAFPAVIIGSGPTGLIGTGDATFTFSSSETGATVAQSLECRLDTADWRPCDSPKVLTDIPDGDHIFAVRSTDAFDKVSPEATRTFSVDTTPPVSSIDDPPLGLTTNPDASIGFSADDPSATFQCSLDGAPFAACTSPQSVTVSGDGPHTFRVRATDSLGNAEATPSVASWTVDRAAPATTILTGPTGTTADTAPTFEFNSTDPSATFTCRFDSAAFAPCASPLTASPPLLSGPHTFEVFATDAAGNGGVASSRQFAVDTSAPGAVISTGPSGNTNDSTPSFTFTTNPVDATAHFECRIDSSEPSAFAPCPTPFATPALADGPHTLDVIAVNASGSAGSSVGRSFTVDTTAPETTIPFGPSGTIRSTSASFQLFSSEGGSTFECRLDVAAFASCTSPVSLTGLAGGAHVFEVRATDPATNVDPTPASRAWTVDTSTLPPPNRPPPNTPAPQPEACHFGSALAACGDPSMTASLRGSARTRGLDLSLTADGGGSALAGASFRLPKPVTVKPRAKPKTVGAGSVTLIGSSPVTIKLKVPAKRKGSLLLGSSGGVTVRLTGRKGPRLDITGIPAGVTNVSVKLKGKKSGLLSSAKRCTTLGISASFTDLLGGIGGAKAFSDLPCAKRGSGK